MQGNVFKIVAYDSIENGYYLWTTCPRSDILRLKQENFFFQSRKAFSKTSAFP